MAAVTSRSHDGQLLLEYEEEDHSYRLNGVVVPGVSSILEKGYPEDEWLKKWKLEQGVEWGLAHLSQAEPPITDEFYALALAEAKWAWKRRSFASTNVGKVLHRYAYCDRAGLEFDTKLVTDAPLAQEMLHCIGQYKEYREEHKNDRVLHDETAVASFRYAYAGTFDALSERDGKIVLTDYKTSKKISGTYWLQLAAYSIAIEEWLGIVVEQWEIARFSKDKEKEIVLMADQAEMAKYEEQWKRCVETARFMERMK